LIGLMILPGVWAQRPPRIGYVYPAGGKMGTTFDAVIGGQYFLNATNVYVTGPGVSVQVVEQEGQITFKEQQALREKLDKIQKKRKAGERLSSEEIQQAEMIRKQLVAFGRKLANPALGEFLELEITIATNAPPGRRELRVGSPAGLSNPLVFYVGQLPETSKDDWKNVPKNRMSMAPAIKPLTDTEITLPATLNGQIPPGGVDKYHFQAKTGQQLVVAVSARELIPYLADAVPGWFQAVVTLYDADGRELAYADDFRFKPDPVIFYKIPKTGEYVLEIKDALYRGREDFVYRVTIGEVPFVSAVYPLGGRVDSKTLIALGGWNLPVTQVTLDLQNKTPGVMPIAVRSSNLIPFALDTLPEIFEREPNSSTNAQPVTLPVIVNGRIDAPGDWDAFRFEGKAGDTVVAEVTARRLDSPLDSILKITDATGKTVVANDDREDKASGLNTHHADSYIAYKLPATGAYTVYLGDTQHKGGPAYSYRLRLSPPRPDFELRATPSSINVRAGASASLTVFALRKDGFAGEIQLSLTNAPAGYKLAAATIPAGQDQVNLTLSAPGSASGAPVTIAIDGRASIAGNEVVRRAVPADDMMQAFAYRHLVPAQELKVYAYGRERSGDEARILSATPVKIPLGGTGKVLVRVPTPMGIQKIQYDVEQGPEGITVKSFSAVKDGTEIVLAADATKLEVGQRGNIILKASGERQQKPDEKKPPFNKRRIPLGSLPAIPFEIVAAAKPATGRR
jgi:hypothetical protein